MRDRGDWVQTYTGRAYWPLDPRMDEICIEDIAHALSMICRFNGHCGVFYSVAEHSVRCWEAAREECPEHAAWALLHDAAEAYLCDLPRPVKRMCNGYKDVERLNEKVIAARFNLRTLEMPPAVKHIDSRMLATEAAQIMAKPPLAWAPMPTPYPVGTPMSAPMGWTPYVAYQRFMDAATQCGMVEPKEASK